jgi:hypothetical protein
VRLYPNFSTRMWDAFGCARPVVTGMESAAARVVDERVRGQPMVRLQPHRPRAHDYSGGCVVGDGDGGLGRRTTGQTRRLREEARTEVQGYLFNVSQPARESTVTQHVRQYVFLAHESGLRQGR